MVVLTQVKELSKLFFILVHLLVTITEKMENICIIKNQFYTPLLDKVREKIGKSRVGTLS